MEKRLQKWMEFLYRPYLKVIRYIYQTYRANKARYKKLTEGKMASSLIQYGAVILLLVWILIWLFASDEDRSRLTQEVIEGLGEFSSPTEN